MAIFRESNEQLERIDFSARVAKMRELVAMIRNGSRSEDELKRFKHPIRARFAERVSFGFRKLQEQFMPRGIRSVHRMNNGDIRKTGRQLTRPFGIVALGGLP